MIVRAPRQQVLWLVRHGETNWNRMGWIQGHLDSPRLTGRGRAQAERRAREHESQRRSACQLLIYMFQSLP